MRAWDCMEKLAKSRRCSSGVLWKEKKRSAWNSQSNGLDPSNGESSHLGGLDVVGFGVGNKGRWRLVVCEASEEIGDVGGLVGSLEFMSAIALVSCWRDACISVIWVCWFCSRVVWDV